MLRSDLVYLIAKCIDQDYSNQSHSHRKLVTKLRDSGKLINTAFISLNYDIFIDNALLEQHPAIDIDYGIDFVNYVEYGSTHIDPETSWFRPRPERSVYLLKIHGSFNWLYCPTCHTMLITPKSKKAAKIFHQQQPCEECESNLQPIIIPPTFYKDMLNSFLQQVYLRTDNLLRKASNIYFIGYSFPDADMHLKYLLKRAEKYCDHTPCIYIIDPNKESLERYMRFFKESRKIQHIAKSFGDFCQDFIL